MLRFGIFILEVLIIAQFHTIKVDHHHLVSKHNLIFNENRKQATGMINVHPRKSINCFNNKRLKFTYLNRKKRK